MPAVTFSEYVEGYQGEYTTYNFEVGPDSDPVQYDPASQTVTVPVHAERDGNSAIIQDAVFTLRQGGSVIAESGEVGITGNMSETAVLEGEIDREGSSTTLDVIFRSEVEDAEASGSFEIATPAPLSRDDLSVSCSVGSQSVEPGESVTVTATVENPTTMDGSGTVTISVSDATAEESVDLPAGESVTVEGTFELSEVGEYQPSVEVAL